MSVLIETERNLQQLLVQISGENGTKSLENRNLLNLPALSALAAQSMSAKAEGGSKMFTGPSEAAPALIQYSNSLNAGSSQFDQLAQS